MGVCSGQVKKKKEPQEAELQIKEKELEQLNLKNFQLTKDIATHQYKKEIDKAKTKEWELQQNKVKIDDLKKQIQKLKIFGNSLPGASDKEKQEFQQQINKTLG